jgi:hypothetical protein
MIVITIVAFYFGFVWHVQIGKGDIVPSYYFALENLKMLSSMVFSCGFVSVFAILAIKVFKWIEIKE